jgi:hypothetical protein
MTVAISTLREDEVGHLCDELAESLGWTPERYEQRRATRIQEGLPDRRYVRAGQRVWVELKRPGGKLTVDQYRWLTSELAAGGLATVIEDAHQLARLFQLLARRSSSLESEARRVCEQWVELCWQRGPRGASGRKRRR